MLQTTVGILGAILVLREVFTFLKYRGDKEAHREIAQAIKSNNELLKENQDILYKILEIDKKLHAMHNVVDEDGVYRWYVRKSLERVIDQVQRTLITLVDLVKDNTTVMKSVNDLIKDRLSCDNHG